ncbi:response regulator [Gottfriedia luciferensis]|uniref:response regulator n=1 Tax=Gottfriedia luciferensis TaxID=178774 RepID=UPI000B454707|nr:response regulator [Gottfriedia luciferensis]
MARILIADDSLFIRTKIGDIVKNAGYEVIGFASNGVEAVLLYNQLKPDLMLLDITMPQKDGLTALKEIKQNHQDAKIIMISAMAQDNIVNEAVQYGAIDFIEKPVYDSKILSALERIFSLQD